MFSDGELCIVGPASHNENGITLSREQTQELYAYLRRMAAAASIAPPADDMLVLAAPVQG